MIALAAGCAALAVLLIQPMQAELQAGSVPGTDRPLSWRPRLTALLAAAVTVLIALGSALPGWTPRIGVLAVLGGLAALVVAKFLRRRRAARSAALTAGRLIDSCEQLAAELSAGQAPARALDRVAQDWPVLGQVVQAQRVAGDVPAAFRALADTVPGAARLRVVAAAWQIAQRTGQGLADTLDAVALDLREAARTQRVVEGELASARATARLIALLPVAALGMGAGVGGNPWQFLVATPVGLVCLAGGSTLMVAGVWWIESIARGVLRQ